MPLELPFEVTREALIRAAVILVLASMPSVAWFFVMRKKMLRRQIYVIRELESAIPFRDSRYWVHGYLVGFTGKYWVRTGSIDKVFVTYVIPPYHSFFYLPVIALLRKRERLEVAVEYRRPLGVKGEAHLYDPRSRIARLQAERDAAGILRRGAERGEVVVAGRRLHYIALGREALTAAIQLAEQLSRYGEVFRVSVIPGRRMLLAVLAPGQTGIREAVETLLKWSWAGDVGSRSKEGPAS